jgi:glycosyltransferase involved in cell wall biosynthesis
MVLRIVILTTSYPERAGDPAGHFIEAEAVHLARQGHDVHVIAPDGEANSGLDVASRLPLGSPVGPLPSQASRHGAGTLAVWQAGGGSLFGLPGALVRARQQPLRLLGLASFVPAVRWRLARLAPFDRIVAHFIVPSAYPLALGVRGELEVVLHGSDVRVVLALPSVIRDHVVAQLTARNARFRFVAEDLRAKFLAVLPPATRRLVEIASRIELPRISVGPVSHRAIKHVRSEHLSRTDDGGRPRWVVCARLVPSKRVDLAIREAARNSAALTVIGDGPLRAELEALASTFEPRARFTGQLPRGDALALIADAHKLVHLSEAEGAPTVIREARALGVPVLATPVGDVARWAAKDPGIEIFRPGAG